jgi:hypothetical protein
MVRRLEHLHPNNYCTIIRVYRLIEGGHFTAHEKSIDTMKWDGSNEEGHFLDTKELKQCRR